ncbi:MAG TPA: hypothetical protein PKD55_04340 [Bellilinea sp.]|nr:hypothetical protein [Bellilinea sp.]
MVSQVSVNFEVFTTQKRSEPFHLQQLTLAAERAVFTDGKEVNTPKTNWPIFTQLK